jgi:hypothetical protein
MLFVYHDISREPNPKYYYFSFVFTHKCSMHVGSDLSKMLHFNLSTLGAARLIVLVHIYIGLNNIWLWPWHLHLKIIVRPLFSVFLLQFRHLGPFRIWDQNFYMNHTDITILGSVRRLDGINRSHYNSLSGTVP